MRIVLLLAFCLTACGGKEEIKYYTNCGDPVCQTYRGATAGLSACASEVVGATCTEEGAECDLHNSCNQRLICADDDPNIPAVRENGHQVDLYGYTSMAVVAIQSQARQIQTLEKRLKELEQRPRKHVNSGVKMA